MENSAENLQNLLKEKLREIFQFENENLDFGIYRILNFRREQIQRFIGQDLIKEVKKQLDLINAEEINKLREQREALERELKKAFGENIFVDGNLKDEFKNTPLGRSYSEIRNQTESLVLSENLEKEIYNHLINFFTRYYEDGDFISKRRYGKHEKYVIPYNGQEIYLHWVNKDQYYIKSTEYFKKYTFKTLNGELTVNFRVVEAEEEKANIKAQEKKFFILDERGFDYSEDTKELNIYFKYCSVKERGIKQERFNEETIKILQASIPEKSPARLIFERDGEKTFIEKHLYLYTRRNTKDYFVHKDLKGFLERELDFYIKNEFLRLEDLQVLEQKNFFDQVRIYLSAIRAFRGIAVQIIEFLAQIENFQKMIWEKKKFVLNTHYVITLDKINEFTQNHFLDNNLNDILKNKKQLKEWKELFGLEIKEKADLIEKSSNSAEKWKKLPIDTRYFPEEFKWKLLSALSETHDLEGILNGLLIKSENWQALNLILNKYYERVQTIYIDPPFNKEQEAEYLYKVGYKDATWLTMLEDRLSLARELLNERGSIFVRCDYNGNVYVKMLLNEIFGKENFRNEIIVKRGSPKAGLFLQFENLKSIGVMYDNLYWYSKNESKVLGKFVKSLPEKRQGYWTSFKKIYDRPTMRYELLGLNLTEGQWMWNRERAYQAVKNYEEYLRQSGKSGETIEQYWERTGRKLEFVRRKNNTIQYWVPPKTETLLDNNWLDIPGYSSGWGFRTENSEILLKRVIESTSDENDLILDFFSGSGTTIATAHKLRRKWIGIEMGEHFYSVVLPRMKKVLAFDKSGISKEKDVKTFYNPQSAGGFFKYQTLEQYEDALENIEFEESSEVLHELPDYFVKYMLEWETKRSNTFLNLEKMSNPFAYKLKVLENYQQKIVNVDLVETFNYLLGLSVKGYDFIEEEDRKYIFVFGEREGKRIAIIWRSIENIDFETDKKLIENQVKNFKPDEVYINGDAAIKSFKSIETLFKKALLN